MWVQFRVGRLGCVCGPGTDERAEGVVQGRMIRLRVWSRAEGLS